MHTYWQQLYIDEKQVEYPYLLPKQSVHPKNNCLESMSFVVFYSVFENLDNRKWTGFLQNHTSSSLSHYSRKIIMNL